MLILFRWTTPSMLHNVAIIADSKRPPILYGLDSGQVQDFVTISCHLRRRGLAILSSNRLVIVYSYKVYDLPKIHCIPEYWFWSYCWVFWDVQDVESVSMLFIYLLFVH